MNSRHTLRILTVCASVLASTAALGRGGETGTLDKEPDDYGAGTFDVGRTPLRPWSPYYLDQDRFRRMRARLSVQPWTSIPGWDKKAFRSEDRYFSDDRSYEILPLLTDEIK